MGGFGRRVGNATSDAVRQAEQTLRRPKDQQDEDAVSAWLNSVL